MKENFKLALSVLWSQFASLFFVLLLVSALISFFLGEKTDGIIILIITFINTALGFYQEFKASKASEKLKNLIQNKVYVFRNNTLVQILVSELVMNDVVRLVAGSVVPVDLEVTESEEALIDESIRTGETIPKTINKGEKLFAGANILGGRITGRVIALGEKSSIAQYRSKLEGVKKWSSFSLFINRVIKYAFIVSLIALLFCMFLLVFVLGKFSLAHFFIFAIAMLVGVVPEVLPLIITIILTRESISLSKNNIIVKRLSSLHGLGAVQFLLTDKTGTITENKLKVLTINDLNNFWENSNAISEGEYERSPMDFAFDDALNSSFIKVKTPVDQIVSFIPFKNEVGYTLFSLKGGKKIARGQIQKILELCALPKTNLFSLSSINKDAQEYEKKGMRVIGIAEALADEWKFCGFVAFHDPIKKSAIESIKIANNQGIMVKILTGDSQAVAQNVAEELNLIKSEENIISLDKHSVISLTDKELRQTIVFAKCTPENKLELIDRYLKIGPVAFLGDGINDALALRRADIGIAVDNASDIAKESGDIILLEKDLSPVLKAVSMGRKALRNIITYIMYTLAGNAGTFFSLLIASFFYPVLPMLPIQILLNNLLTDLPLMLLVTDNPDEYALRHVPHFHPSKLLKRILIFGLISSCFDFIYFQLYKNASVAEFQTGWFIFSVLAELALVLSIRSSRSIFKSPALSTPLALGMIICAGLSFVLITIKPIAEVFKFAQLTLPTILILLGITFIYICVNEIFKYFMRKRNLYNKPISLPKIFKTG